MSVTGTPVQQLLDAPVSKEDVRMFLRDYAPNNILLDDVQFTDTEVTSAIKWALNEYEIISPVGGGNINEIPPAMLLLGVSAWLMKSESFLQLRNQATYQDGDVAPIGIDDKHTLYLQLSRALKEEWISSVKAYKQQLNLEGAYGSLSSGYRNVGRFHNN